MLGTLYSYFHDVVFGGVGNIYPINSTFTLFGATWSFVDYFSLLCAVVTLITIFVLCCLFIYKIIKLIGGLIR